MSSNRDSCPEFGAYWCGKRRRIATPAYQRGMRFLLDSQCDDGSWFAATRSKPVQSYFDNGDPHGKNQFISIPAACWAVAALSAGLAE